MTSIMAIKKDMDVEDRRRNQEFSTVVFLDMAKDGQAVYEFLQNAVDAGSSHFTMVWGQDPVDGNHYVMVANNGEMFNQKSIRSILNVGSSTKTADSQNIGKFGIGFKLAHRLVGKRKWSGRIT